MTFPFSTTGLNEWCNRRGILLGGDDRSQRLGPEACAARCRTINALSSGVCEGKSMYRGWYHVRCG